MYIKMMGIPGIGKSTIIRHLVDMYGKNPGSITIINEDLSTPDELSEMTRHRGSIGTLARHQNQLIDRYEANVSKFNREANWAQNLIIDHTPIEMIELFAANYAMHENLDSSDFCHILERCHQIQRNMRDRLGSRHVMVYLFTEDVEGTVERLEKRKRFAEEADFMRPRMRHIQRGMYMMYNHAAPDEKLIHVDKNRKAEDLAAQIYDFAHTCALEYQGNLRRTKLLNEHRLK